MRTLYISIRIYLHDALLLSPEIFAFRLDMGPLAMWWAANKPPTLPEAAVRQNRLPHGPPMSSPAKISCPMEIPHSEQGLEVKIVQAVEISWLSIW
jgi:hypothetical protein